MEVAFSIFVAGGILTISRPMEKMKPLVSIIMAVYNGADLLNFSIQSIVEQILHNWEFIIVNDGSCDATSEILHKWEMQDRRILTFSNKKNKGLAASLNFAISKAKGKYIARMDHDDVCYRSRLLKQAEFLESTPNVHVLGTGVKVVDQAGSGRYYLYRPEYHEELARRIFWENPFYHPTVMVRREFYEIMGGYLERYRRVQDYDLWLRAYRLFRFHNLQRPLLSYRIREDVAFTDSLYSALALIQAARREGFHPNKVAYIIRIPVAAFLKKFRSPKIYLFCRKVYKYYKNRAIEKNFQG